MHRLIAFALATTALAVVATEALPALAQAPSAAAAKPQYGTFGFDTAGMDRAVAPGDDYFEFANGTWAKNTAIPADKARYGMFNVLDDLSKERTRTIIEEQAKDPNSKIGNAYASFMDEEAIESKGLTPFEPWLNEVRGIKSKKNLVKLYSRADHLGVSI